MARPSLFNSRIKKAILDAVRQGATLSDAAAAAGINAATLRRWRRKGETAAKKPARQRTPDERRFVRFCAAIERASAEAEMKALAVIFHAVDIDLDNAKIAEQRLALKAATWFLVHRFPEDYSTRPRKEEGDFESFEPPPSAEEGMKLWKEFLNP